MEREPKTKLRIGEWVVDADSGQISKDGKSAKLEVRALRLLLSLADRAGEVVSIDELLDQVWSGVTVSPDSVYQAVTSLRRVLGDDSKNPKYIVTVPRLGYRMVATVTPLEKEVDASSHLPDFALGTGQETASNALASSKPGFRFKGRLVWLGVAAIFLILVVSLYVQGKNENGKRPPATDAAANSQKPIRSLAVLPFLDLTEGMNEEPFADGMTEELIDKLSKIQGLRVPSPTASFYFKGKHLTVTQMARSLGVDYVLDGSVRKSGGRLRVAARLVRVDSGYVVWSESYDRPFHDILMVQDDIAGEVTKALQSSIQTGSGTAQAK